MIDGGRTSISVRHNAEVSHRLFQTPGKCQNIHGHSMLITISLRGAVGATGMLGDADFGTIKRYFRDYVDSVYDHHLLLNEKDPWAGALYQDPSGMGDELRLPGASLFDGDPTTENIARWVAEWCRDTYAGTFTGTTVDVAETAVNAARYELDWPVERFAALARTEK
jgi:6-pyruvoyltetrahydropterin/6-carboxytetrahydropterin synthase